jgi:NAD(P)-dependent dehydrogenase (short-subunit alcohol dehydrogenase family)
MSLYPPDERIVDALLEGDAQGVARDFPQEESKPMAYYIATKTALARWMRKNAVSADWGGRGIAMNAIAPGLIETPMTRGTLDDPVLRGRLIDMHPQVQDVLSQPPEIAALAVYLLSEPAGLLVGQCIWADRGTEAISRGDQTW